MFYIDPCRSRFSADRHTDEQTTVTYPLMHVYRGLKLCMHILPLYPCMHSGGGGGGGGGSPKSLSVRLSIYYVQEATFFCHYTRMRNAECYKPHCVSNACTIPFIFGEKLCLLAIVNWLCSRYATNNQAECKTLGLSQKHHQNTTPCIVKPCTLTLV